VTDSLRHFLDGQELGEPQPDPFCGRCGGPSGPEGAWCDDCIRECKEYTRWLDREVTP
jgi:hypothetical protein